MKLVSIIVPVYNSEKYLEECINSIINQSYENIEAIFVNDGSTDNSLNILNKYKNNNKVKIINQTNAGAPTARNNGFKNSNGEYIMYFDSDDILDKDAIRDMMKDAEDEDLIIGSYYIIDKDGNEMSEQSHILEDKILKGEKMYKETYLLSPFPDNKLYKASIIKEFNISFANVKIGQDLNFFLKYMAVCNQVRFIKKIVCYYRIVENSISHSYSFKIFEIVNSIADAKEFYEKNNKKELIEKYVTAAEIYHYYGQVNKLFHFEKKEDRKKVFDYFSDEINKIDFSKTEIEVKDLCQKFKIKRIIKNLYVSNLYKKIHISKELKKKI